MDSLWILGATRRRRRPSARLATRNRLAGTGRASWPPWLPGGSCPHPDNIARFAPDSSPIHPRYAHRLRGGSGGRRRRDCAVVTRWLGQMPCSTSTGPAATVADSAPSYTPTWPPGGRSALPGARAQAPGGLRRVLRPEYFWPARVAGARHGSSGSVPWPRYPRVLGRYRVGSDSVGSRQPIRRFQRRLRRLTSRVSSATKSSLSRYQRLGQSSFTSTKS